MQSWSLSSWSQFSYSQDVEYPDLNARDQALRILEQRPPLIAPETIRKLKSYLAEAEHQRAFLLQGGDCAESFQDCNEEIISKKLRIMEEMSRILTEHLKKPVIQIGRIAGQFAKARSEITETRGESTLPSYRGDLIHAAAFTSQARTPDPKRLLQGYQKSAETLEIIAAHKNEPYFFTSHEALHLPYEQALVRKEAHTNQWYLSSTHLPWIGVRTNYLNSAHLEFVRGLINPIGIKVGPHATPEWLFQVLSRLNPERESGRILLITRFGTTDLAAYLSPLIQLVQEQHFPVAWSCDPMHGNTRRTASGLKTRSVETILNELEQTLEVHQQHGSHLGGIHLELTGDHVTECTGGSQGLEEHHLCEAYHSLVDPRLNYEQSLELALKFGLMHT